MPNPAFLIFILITLCASGCSQSGSADATGSGSGSVSVLIDERPEEPVSEAFRQINLEFDQIMVTAASITLIGEGGHVLLSDEAVTFDLLDLKYFSKLLALSVAVPAGSYTKLRFDVTEIVMIDRDADGNVVRKEFPKLPSEKIDMLARDGFTVGPDHDLIISLSMKTGQSIKFHTTGNGRYMFRPVVFVEVDTVVSNELIRKSGVVLQKQAASFHLCQQGATQVSAGCVRVHVSGSTRFITEDIEPGSFDALKNGDAVTVLGTLAGDAASIDAIQVLHDSDRHALFAGEFDSAVVNDSASFTLTADAPGAVAGTTLDCMLPLATIINKDGVVVGPGAISSGVRARVFGLPVPGNGSVTAIKAAYILLE